MVIVGDMAKALSERKGETTQQQQVRTQATIYMIMGFLPRDVIETMLASHCVMFHELMLDCVRDGFCAEQDKVQRRRWSELIMLNKAFCRNLDELQEYQQRPAEGRRDAPQNAQGAPASTDPAPRPRADVPAGVREQTIAAETLQAPAPASSSPDLMAAVQPLPAGPEVTGPVVPASDEIAAIYRSTADASAARHANPEAVAALKAGDAAGFARAMGIEQPSEAFLAAAASPGSPFDPRASGPWPEGSWPKGSGPEGMGPEGMGPEPTGPARRKT